MNNLLKIFLFMCIVVGGLLLLQLLPEMEILGYQLRPVSLFSDILNDEDSPDFEDSEYQQLAESDTQNLSSTQHSNTKRDSIRTLSEDGLDVFYQRLIEIDTLSRPVRIAYFGDSFVEGDILTGELRILLQDYFGGSGVGFVDVNHPTADLRATVRTTCRNFSSHAATDKEGFKNALSGIDLIYAIPTDTLASFSLTMHGKKEGELSTVYYHSHPDVEFSARVDGKKVEDVDTLISGNITTATIEKPMRKICWDFHLKCDEDTLRRFDLPKCPVFGAAIEGKRGIVLDNFSLRGNSGMVLSRVPEQTLRNFLKLRHYDLIILGYGLNIASKKSTNYEFYERQMQRIAERFFRLSPQTSIMIAGVGDRAEKTEKGIVSRPEIMLLNKSQQRMAKNSGCAFWNMYLTMKRLGGIKAMTEATPPQASKDYTHINYLGGKILAEKLFRDILDGFQRYKQKHDEENNNNIPVDYSDMHGAEL